MSALSARANSKMSALSARANSKMSALFTPLKLGSVTIPNRVGMSALTRNRATGTVPNDIMEKYYVQRAADGAGLIVSEGILITWQGTEWPEAPGIWDKFQITGWKKITDAVHAAGSKIYCQIFHPGRLSHPDAPQQVAAGVPVYGPSAIAARGGNFRYIPGSIGYVKPTEIPDPTVLIAQFKQAAVNAKEAGFDGYTAPTATSLTNSSIPLPTSAPTSGVEAPKNRAQIALEILKALVEVWGPDVALKLSLAGEYNDMGIPLQDTIDTFGYLLREADKLGLEYVAFVRYSAFLDPEFDGSNAPRRTTVIGTFAPFLPDTPVFVNCGVTPAEAEALVASGTAAGVFMDMNWITHPDVGRRIAAGKPLDNAPDYAHLYGAEGGDPSLGFTEQHQIIPMTIVILDLLGLIASALQLVDTVVTARGYIKDFLNAPKEQRAFFLEVQNLRPLLLELHRRFEGSDSVGTQHLGAPLGQLNTMLDGLAQRLSPAGLIGAYHRGSWPLWGKKEVQVERLKVIERFKSLISAWLGIDVWDATQQQKENHCAMLEAVKDAARDLEDHQDRKQRDEIIEWWSSVNFFTRQADIFIIREPGTGEWFLASAEFKAWTTGLGNILWCPGIPGAGKTVLASVVVDYLREALALSGNIGIAAIYLNHKEAEIQTPSNLLANLGEDIETQIVGRSDGMFLLAKLHIMSLTERHTVKAVREALKNMPSDLQNTYDEVMARINQQSDDDRKLALSALSWISNAKRFLRVPELREALAVEPGTTALDPDNLLDMDIVLSVCAGLIIVDQVDGIVRLIHYTTQRYLDRIQASHFPSAQTDITAACMTYLSFQTFLKTPHLVVPQSTKNLQNRFLCLIMPWNIAWFMLGESLKLN
ncbi:hypothetical protein DFH09DRAFT_1476179 [Mycena vulgaris]|nr:hypothetical protein DFH09DRAFT_1476179 [Mycena vulgaris]